MVARICGEAIASAMNTSCMLKLLNYNLKLESMNSKTNRWSRIDFHFTKDFDQVLAIYRKIAAIPKGVIEQTEPDGITKYYMIWDAEKEEMKKFSKLYPDVLMEVTFDEGSCNYKNYYMNGEYQSAQEIRMFAPFRSGNPYEINLPENIFEILEQYSGILEQPHLLSRMVLSCKNALADLQGIMPEYEPSGERLHPAWETIKELENILQQVNPKQNQSH